MADTPKEFQAPPVTDERSAASVIEQSGLLSSMFNDEDAPDSSEGDAVEESEESEDNTDDDSDTTDQEIDPSGEDEEATETDSGQSFEAPKSWTAEEKAEFSKLPPALQATISRRESERDRGISQKLNEIAQERQQFTAAQQQAQQAEQHYAQTLNRLLEATVPEIKQFENVDWQKLATDNPSEYVRLTAARDHLRSRVAAMDNEIKRVQQNQNQAHALAKQRFEAEQLATLKAKHPELSDPVKANAIANDVFATFTKDYGFTQQELGEVNDHRFVRVMMRLAQLEKAEKAKISAQTKKGGGNAPRIMSGGASHTREDKTGTNLSKQMAELKRTGSDRTAAKILESLF